MAQAWLERSVLTDRVAFRSSGVFLAQLGTMVTQYAQRVDRLRRQAISKYIADHREDLLRLLLPAHLSDRDAKRREF